MCMASNITVPDHLQKSVEHYKTLQDTNKQDNAFYRMEQLFIYPRLLSLPAFKEKLAYLKSIIDSPRLIKRWIKDEIEQLIFDFDLENDIKVGFSKQKHSYYSSLKRKIFISEAILNRANESDRSLVYIITNIYHEVAHAVDDFYYNGCHHSYTYLFAQIKVIKHYFNTQKFDIYRPVNFNSRVCKGHRYDYMIHNHLTSTLDDFIIQSGYLQRASKRHMHDFMANSFCSAVKMIKHRYGVDIEYKENNGVPEFNLSNYPFFAYDDIVEIEDIPLSKFLPNYTFYFYRRRSGIQVTVIRKFKIEVIESDKLMIEHVTHNGYFKLLRANGRF